MMRILKKHCTPRFLRSVSGFFSPNLKRIEVFTDGRRLVATQTPDLTTVAVYRDTGERRIARDWRGVYFAQIATGCDLMIEHHLLEAIELLTPSVDVSSLAA